MSTIWNRLICIALLCTVSAAANAIPVSVTSTYWEWYFDHAVTSDLTTHSDLQIGDCVRSCRGVVDGLEYRAGSAAAPVISSSHATMATHHSYGESATSFSAMANIDIHASVHPTWAHGGAWVAAGLSRFITTFEVYEPVLFTGTVGLSEGTENYLPSMSPITVASGSILQPGRYYNTLSFDAIGTGGWLSAGALSLSQAVRLDYHFASVSVPAPAPVLLVGMGMLLMAGYRRYATRR